MANVLQMLLRRVALGCDVRAIASSLVFEIGRCGALVLASGGRWSRCTFQARPPGRSRPGRTWPGSRCRQAYVGGIPDRPDLPQEPTRPAATAEPSPADHNDVPGHHSIPGNARTAAWPAALGSAGYCIGWRPRPGGARSGVRSTSYRRARCTWRPTRRAAPPGRAASRGVRPDPCAAAWTAIPDERRRACPGNRACQAPELTAKRVTGTCALAADPAAVGERDRNASPPGSCRIGVSYGSLTKAGSCARRWSGSVRATGRRHARHCGVSLIARAPPAHARWRSW
jgi:hypothetical protein